MVKKIALCLAIALYCSLEARLYFLHIPKTAGTTLRLMLELQVSVDEIYPHRIYTRTKRSINKALVSGHFPYWFCKKLDPDFSNAFKVTILRDPIERYLSYLRAIKRGDRLFADLDSILDQRLSKKSKLSLGLIDNALCRYLTADPSLEGNALLDSAKQALQEFDCILFFDNFTEDATDLFKRLGIALNKQDIPHMNVTVKDTVSEKLLEKVKQLNALDIELYQYAKNQLPQKDTTYQLRTQSFDDILQTTNFIDYSFDRPMNGKGWHYRETFGEYGLKYSTYRWVMNGPADIYFSLEEGNDYYLYFTAQTLTSEIAPRVQVNQKEVDLLKLDDQIFATYFGKIPRDYIDKNPTHLSFYSLNSYPYSDIHPNYPNRNYPPLSFAVNSIKLIPIFSK